MARSGWIALCLILCTATAFAESDAIAKRKKILKSFGEATKPVASMIKGVAPFDLPTVQKALARYVQSTKALTSLFPDDSKTGGKTEVKPAIWDEKEDFNALFDKLHKDATAATTTIVDEASFKTTMPKVLGDCKACHDKYREKK